MAGGRAGSPSPARRRARARLLAPCARLTRASAEAATNIFTTIGITRAGHARQRADPRPYAFKARGHAAVAARSARRRTTTRTTCRCGCPTRRGNVANLAAFRGQTLDAARARPEGLHADPLLRHDGRRLRRRRLHAAYTDGTTQSVDGPVPDWCPSRNRRRTTRRSARWQRPLDPQRRGRRALRHLPRARPTSPRTRSSSRSACRRDHARRGRRRAVLPDGAHARAARRLVRAAGPLRRADFPTTRSRRSPTSRSTRRARRQRRLVHEPVRVTLDAHDEGGRGVEQMMWRLDGGQPQPYGGRSRSTTTASTARVPRDRRRRQRRGLQLGRAQGRPRRAVDDRGGRSREPFGTDGWYDGAVTVRCRATTARARA